MNPDTQLTLWLGAFRYYLGRRTFNVPEDFPTLEEAVARAVIALKEQNPRNSPRKPS